MSDAADAEPGQHATTRIEAFSDGVIAIVATIMVLELHEPALAFLSGDFWVVFEELAPDLSVYALSFLMVAILLVNHHVIIHLARRATASLYWWNANLLFWMALIPLSTATYGKHPLTPLAASFYGLILAANMVSLALLRRSVVREHRATISSGVVERAVKAWRRDLALAALYLVSIPLAYLWVYLPIAIFVAVPVMNLVSRLQTARL